MYITNYFDNVPPLGWHKDMDSLDIGLNLAGYASCINTVAECAGYTVSMLVATVWISRIAGIIRIAANVFAYFNNSDSTFKDLITHTIRGALEIAGFAPVLIIADIAATYIDWSCCCPCLRQPQE